MSEAGENATAVILPKGVEEVGQFLYTAQEGRWTIHPIKSAGMERKGRE
jgi:hypothetical protein